eukprot:GDKI01049653.1.p1 GENE.GDKI01049653.1~~GDKI01049653.1.p1  ORF type:complete len:311 (-),score=64.65 GDKI01049653.1:40-972(-)
MWRLSTVSFPLLACTLLVFAVQFVIAAEQCTGEQCTAKEEEQWYDPGIPTTFKTSEIPVHLSSVTKPWWLESTVDNARSMALFFDREARRFATYMEGNVATSERALRMYFEVARGPNVKTICEIGFNAGHSAAIFLVANPHAKVVSFDVGQFNYTVANANLMKDIFGDRFFMVWGDSKLSVPSVRAELPDLRCDVIAIDGDHSTETAFLDLMNMRELASCRNWVLFDDPGYRSTNLAWQGAKDKGIVTQTECFIDVSPKPSYMFIEFPDHRSWCLGFMNIADREPECKFFDHSPNTPHTHIRPIPVELDF